MYLYILQYLHDLHHINSTEINNVSVLLYVTQSEIAYINGTIMDISHYGAPCVEVINNDNWSATGETFVPWQWHMLHNNLINYTISLTSH